MRISDWSSDVCSSDLAVFVEVEIGPESRRAKPAADHLRRREAEPWQYRRSRRLVRHDCNPRCPDDAPGRGLEPVERVARPGTGDERSEEHTSELQSLMPISYAVFCLKKKTRHKTQTHET